MLLNSVDKKILKSHGRDFRQNMVHWRRVEKYYRRNEEMEPKQKRHPVVGVTVNRYKVSCCKEQYCIGTWNVRSTNQGKLKVVK